MNEILILKVKLNHLLNFTIINYLCKVGYEKTGNKFSVELNGSKGYLSHLEITCEGYQTFGLNRIFCDDFYTKKGHVRKREISIFYSDHNGIRLKF